MNEEFDKIALVTLLYDYPDYYMPLFYNNALKYFKADNIHILRYNELKVGLSYYEKFFFYKIEKVRDHIVEKLLGKYKYILLLDATDTNFLREPYDIIDNFKSFDKSIVFCGEKFMWPPTDYAHLYEDKPKITEARYLNAGGWFGYIDEVLRYLNIMINNPLIQDDQGSWTIQYLLNNDIVIDQERKIFFSSFNAKDKVNIIDGKVEFNGINPCIVHDNGGYNDETIKLCEYFNK